MKHRILAMAALAAAAFGASAAHAADTARCATGMVCASDPAKVLEALIASHRGAKAEPSDTDNPMISLRSGDGCIYVLYFEDCDDAHTHCASLDFRALSDAEAKYDLGYVNSWNVHKRLIKAALEENGQVQLDYDMTTVGGVSRASMVDLVSRREAALTGFADYDPANPTA